MDAAMFDLRCRQIDSLINQRCMRKARTLAELLVNDAMSTEIKPDNLGQAYFLLHLATCLTSRGNGLTASSQQIIAEAQRNCPDFTNRVHGDMLRDRVLGLTRTHRAENLLAAGKLLPSISNLHATDPNRLACLTGVSGRIAYARRNYGVALTLHEQAQTMWNCLGTAANDLWVYNNRVHWLKAIVAAGERQSPLARRLAWRIANNCPEGTKNRGGEVRVILLPIVGNWLHDLALRYR
jgi:hypothetical protein